MEGSSSTGGNQSLSNAEVKDLVEEEDTMGLSMLLVLAVSLLSSKYVGVYVYLKVVLYKNL